LAVAFTTTAWPPAASSSANAFGIFFFDVIAFAFLGFLSVLLLLGRIIWLCLASCRATVA